MGRGPSRARRLGDARGEGLATADVSTVVDVGAGRLRGLATGEGLEFLGIPYAGASRFAPPVPAGPWKGTRDALTPGPAAPQPERIVTAFTHGELPATDERACLNLNVFTPSLTGSRPVLVWLHGGGFAIGHASASIYHGARLAQAADAVVVTLNYRLGSLGWLCHPALATDSASPSGNWGLLDQIAALRWVRENVASFGGDPGGVTLAGQSAGALSALDLLIAPQAEGLFRRLILQSPPLGDVAQEPDRAREWAEALSTRAGGSHGFDPQLLRALAAERIVALHEQLLEHPVWRGTRGGALPTIEPVTLALSPLEQPEARPEIDVLIGTTAHEGSFFFNSPWRPSPPPDRIPAVVGYLPGVTEPAATIERYRARAVAAGRADDLPSLLVEIATDAIVAEPTARWAGARAAALAERGGHVYRFRVDHPGAGPEMGATHTVEVPLLFGTWGDGGPGERLGGRGPRTAAVAHELAEAWRRFVHGEGPGWGSLAGAAPEVGVFGGAQPFAAAPADERSWREEIRRPAAAGRRL
jgi:para-nitrobenzyl esterase